MISSVQHLNKLVFMIKMMYMMATTVIKIASATAKTNGVQFTPKRGPQEDSTTLNHVPSSSTASMEQNVGISTRTKKGWISAGGRMAGETQNAK